MRQPAVAVVAVLAALSGGFVYAQEETDRSVSATGAAALARGALGSQSAVSWPTTSRRA